MYFYLVALQEGEIKEPVWFVHDDIAGVEGENVSLWLPSRKEPSRVETEALEIAANVSEREQMEPLEILLNV